MPYKLKPIAEQVIVVTGASSGIGLATAYEAANRGAKVVLAARNKAALRGAVQRIKESGGRAVAVVADVTKADDLVNLAETAIRAYGGFDTWVNNAGIGVFARLDEVASPIAGGCST